MKDENYQGKDERVSRALKAWTVEASLPPRFQDQVWQRITRAEAEAKITLWAVFQSWLGAALSRRAVAVAYLGILLVAGLIMGYWSGRQRSRQIEAGLSERYLQWVDPYQTPAGNK